MCVLSCVVSGGGPDILLTADSERPALVLLASVLVHSPAPPKGICPRDIFVVSPGGVNPTVTCDGIFLR